MNIVDTLLKIALLGSSWVLYLLLGLSVISVGVVSERLYFFWKHNRGGGDPLRERLLVALRDGDPERVEGTLRNSGSIEGKVVGEALAFREGGAKAFLDAFDSELAKARKSLETGTNFLGTVGNNAPFIGLFGTVIGVIDAFHQLGSAAARAGAMGDVMSGIAEALIATGVGIFVALPAVIAYNVVQARIGEIEGNATSLGRLVAAWLETRERGGALRAPASAPAGARSGAPAGLMQANEAELAAVPGAGN